MLCFQEKQSRLRVGEDLDLPDDVDVTKGRPCVQRALVFGRPTDKLPCRDALILSLLPYDACHHHRRWP